MPLQFKPMPSMFPEMRIWGCMTPKYSFVISEEEGKYTASAKADGQGKRIELGGFQAHNTFDSAQQACVYLLYPKAN